MADHITDGDVYILEQIADRYDQRNIIGQSRQITGAADAEKASRVLRKVAARLKELSRQYPSGIPAPPPKGTENDQG